MSQFDVTPAGFDPGLSHGAQDRTADLKDALAKGIDDFLAMPSSTFS